VDHFFRHEAGRLVAVLTRFFGWRNFDLVEDMVQATLVDARYKRRVDERKIAGHLRPSENRHEHWPNEPRLPTRLPSRFSRRQFKPCPAARGDS
jgi:hypothetical protein